MKIFMNKQKYTCPICGYINLSNKPNNSCKICACCGYEFGSFMYNSENLKVYFPDAQETPLVYSFIRNIWLQNNTPWHSATIKAPENWDLIKQLNNIPGFLFEKNKKSGGYGEFQYCKNNMPIKNLLKYKNIEPWKDDSLFISSSTFTELFFNKYYEPLLQNAHLSNSKIGFDYFGLNYYTPKQTLELFNKLKESKNLPDIEIFLSWLKLAFEKYNGFYYYGI